jgi:hypothetical protein
VISIPAKLDRLAASLDRLRLALAALEPSLERAWRGWTLVPVFMLACVGAAAAQSPTAPGLPAIGPNVVWTPDQWKTEFASKQDYLGYVPAPSRVLDVIAAGAKCDGVTDDFAAINAAATAAASGNVKAIYFPPSATPCMLSHWVTIPSGVTFWAYPGSATIKPTAGNVTQPLLLNFSNSADGGVYGLVIDGGGQDFPNTGNVVQAFNASHFVLDNVTVQHTRGIGYLLSTSITNSGVRNSTFRDIGNHWKTTIIATDRQQAVAFCCGVTANSFGNFATGNYFSDIGLDAISAGGQTNFLASGNRCELANNQLAIILTGPYAACVYSTLNTEMTVTNNIVDGASGNAIDLNTTTTLVVSGNYVTGSGQAGIGFATTNNVTISGNVTLGNGIWASSVQKGGISLGAANGNVTLTGNISNGNPYGAQGFPWLGVPFSATALVIDPSNILTGNATANVGGITSYATNAVCNAGTAPAAPAC